jgi:O-antigen ligase
VVAVLGGVVAGALVATGLWIVAAGLALAGTLCVLVVRSPWSAVLLWVLVTPLAGTTDGGGARAIYWLVHRGLPLVAVAAIVVGPWFGLRRRDLPRLGLPELLMAAYAGVTLVSVLYTAPSVVGRTTLLFDRVVVPMCIYLVVRLLRPGDRELRQLLSAVAVTLVVQSAIGMASWSGPALLRPEWLGKVGERTTGSLQAVDVFGTTMIFCGLYLFHVGARNARSYRERVVMVLLVLLSVLMIFMSFSRSTWAAASLVLLALAFRFRRYLRRSILWAAIGLFALAATGILNSQWQYAQYRLESERSEASALSRLPVYLAAWRMFEAKPLTGFGYENFDRYDRPFQGRVGDLVFPEKNHASHNVYLTLLAEQGVLGFVLYLAPAACWLTASIARRRRLAADGIRSRDLVFVLWLVVLAHLVVNNFSRMHLPFGLGMWWLTLGLIASIVGACGAERSHALVTREVHR